MANIRTYTSNEAFQGLHPSDLAVRGAEEMGRTFGEVGRELGSVAKNTYDQYQQQNDANDLTSAYTDIQQAKLNATTHAQDTLDNGDVNDPNLVGNWAESAWAPTEQSILDKYSGASSEVRNKIRMELAQQGADVQTWMHGKQSEMAGKKAVDDWNAGEQADANLVNRHPELLQSTIDGRDRMADSVLTAHGIPTADAKAKARSNLAYSAAQGQLDILKANTQATPAEAATLRSQFDDENGPYAKNLTPEQHKVLNTELDGIKDTNLGIQNALIKQQFPDMLKQIDEGGDASAAMQAAQAYAAGARTKEEKVEAVGMQRDILYHKQFGGVMAATKDEPDDEIQSDLNAVHAAWKAATTDADRLRLASTEKAMTAARESRDKEFHADPATYSLAHDGVTQARAAAFAKNETPQNFAAYATAQEAYQRRLFPGDVPKITTQPMRDNLAQAMQGIRENGPAGVAAAGGALQNMATMTGSKWVQVSRELHTANILNDDQFVAATLYGKPTGKVLAGQILQSSAMSEADRHALHTVSFDKALKAASDALQPLAQSLGNAGPDGADLIRANATALAHLMQIRGDTDEAPALAQTTVMDEFTFTGRNGSTTLRVPNRPDLDANKINTGSQKVLNELGDNVNVPQSQSGLNMADSRKLYLDRIKHTGVWYTNKDGSGAILYDIDSGSPVQEWQGRVEPPSFDYKHAAGMKQAGTLDPWHRPVLHNPDGSYSTTSSMSIGTENGETLIPTVVNGKRLSKAEAIAHFNKTGENFGVFDTPENADRFATALHNAQASMYDSRGNPLGAKAVPVARNWKLLMGQGESSNAEAVGQPNIDTSEHVLGGAH